MCHFLNSNTHTPLTLRLNYESLLWLKMYGVKKPPKSITKKVCQLLEIIKRKKTVGF
jgi:hypothetical protein